MLATSTHRRGNHTLWVKFTRQEMSSLEKLQPFLRVSVKIISSNHQSSFNILLPANQWNLNTRITIIITLHYQEGRIILKIYRKLFEPNDPLPTFAAIPLIIAIKPFKARICIANKGQFIGNVLLDNKLAKSSNTLLQVMSPSKLAYIFASPT